MGEVLPVGKHEHFAEGRCLSSIQVEKIDVDRLTLRDTILFAASLDNCVSHKRFPKRKKPRKFTQLSAFDKEKGRVVYLPQAIWGQSPRPGMTSTISPFGGRAV